MSPAPMFNRDFGPRSEKMMERDAISAAMIQSLRPAEAATFARPPQPHAPSGSGQGAQPWTPWSRSDIDPATSNSLSAHGTDNSPSASEGDPRPSRPVLPIPNLDRKLRPLLRTPCRVDHSQRETYPSIYPAAGPGTTSAINTQTLQPLQPVQSQQTLPPLRSIPFIKDLLPPDLVSPCMKRSLSASALLCLGTKRSLCRSADTSSRMPTRTIKPPSRDLSSPRARKCHPRASAPPSFLTALSPSTESSPRPAIEKLQASNLEPSMPDKRDGMANMPPPRAIATRLPPITATEEARRQLLPLRSRTARATITWTQPVPLDRSPSLDLSTMPKAK